MQELKIQGLAMYDNDTVMTFPHELFGELRSIKIDGEPWFIAKDVADVLGYGKTADMTKVLDSDERRNMPLKHSPSDVTQMTFINEPGLYSVIFNSQKPGARAFKKWVFSEVLPSIRKTGSYSIFDSKATKTKEEINQLLKDHNNAVKVYRGFYEGYCEVSNMDRYDESAVGGARHAQLVTACLERTKKVTGIDLASFLILKTGDIAAVLPAILEGGIEPINATDYVYKLKAILTLKQVCKYHNLDQVQLTRDMYWSKLLKRANILSPLTEYAIEEGIGKNVKDRAEVNVGRLFTALGYTMENSVMTEVCRQEVARTNRPDLVSAQELAR